MDLKHKMECFTNGIYFMCPTGNELIENIWNREAHWKVTRQNLSVTFLWVYEISSLPVEPVSNSASLPVGAMGYSYSYIS